MNDIVPAAGAPGTAINAWDPNSGAALPAYLADALGDVGSNIPDRLSVPSLSYEGKIWQIVKGKERTRLEVRNGDGDMVPVPVMRVVIVGVNADRGRAYYEGTYNPAASSKPKCWSADGRAPDDSVADKMAATCNGCPMSVKGSKVDQGREMVACSSHRMLAVVPAFEVGSDPLRLKIAVTSDYDKDVVEHGWFAFRQYADWLKSRGINHTGLVVTKMKMDPSAPHPKILFALDRILNPEEIAIVKATINSPKTAELLAEKWTAAGTNGTPIDDSDIAPQPNLQTIEPAPAAQQVVDQTPSPTAAHTDALALALADGWQVHPDNGAYSFKGSEVITNEELAARYAKPAPAPAPVAPPAPVVPAPVATISPRDAAIADGWVQHPDSPPHAYKGQEVLEWVAVEGKYAAPAASVSAPAAPDSEPQAAATTAAGGTAAIPADVQSMLDQWSTN